MDELTILGGKHLLNELKRSSYIPATKAAPKPKTKQKPKEEKWHFDFLLSDEHAPVDGWSVHTGHLTVNKPRGEFIYSCNLSGYASNCSILVVSNMGIRRNWDQESSLSKKDAFKHLIKLIEDEELRDFDDEDDGIERIINMIPSILEYTSVNSETTEGAIAAGFIPVYSYKNYNSGNTVTKLIYATDMSHAAKAYNRNYLNFTITNQK